MTREEALAAAEAVFVASIDAAHAAAEEAFAIAFDVARAAASRSADQRLLAEVQAAEAVAWAELIRINKEFPQ